MLAMDPSGLDVLFLYGANPGEPNSDYFANHARAQAAAFNIAHSKIIGYGTMLSPHSPSPLVPIRGSPSETAHVFSAATTKEFNHALRTVSNITSITWNGHSWNLGKTHIDVKALDRTNVSSTASICLNGCFTGRYNNNSGNFSAQIYADYFGVPTRGVLQGLSFGAPTPALFKKEWYIDMSPGSLREDGGLWGQQPDFMWAQPRSPQTTPGT